MTILRKFAYIILHRCKDIPTACETDANGDMLCNKCAENVDNTMKNIAVQKMISKLETKCLTLSQNPNYNKQNNNEETEGINVIATQLSNECQCKWIGKIEEYETHSKKCEFLMVNCDECKIFECQRKLLNKHLNTCPQVKINCELCSMYSYICN